MKNEIILLTKPFTEWMNEGCETSGTFEIMGVQQTKTLKLKDGSSLSIQASRAHYCHPKQNSKKGDFAEYTSFEVGFPSVYMEELDEYCEDLKNPTKTVYGYVPKEVIEKLIKKRGGVVGLGE